MGSSHRDKPWTWLSSWYVYRVMRKARARLKVVIADCCYSNLLPQLGEEPLLPGVLGELDEGPLPAEQVELPRAVEMLDGTGSAEA